MILTCDFGEIMESHLLFNMAYPDSITENGIEFKEWIGDDDEYHVTAP